MYIESRDLVKLIDLKTKKQNQVKGFREVIRQRKKEIETKSRALMEFLDLEVKKQNQVKRISEIA